MSGYNPNGTYYHDLVYWINYFNGGDAVHGFVRASYGFPQSLGCVELPIPVAAQVYPQVHIGTLVTVMP
jgi:lipoprotein-anchoring transpeptidase ErfK/SrfK